MCHTTISVITISETDAEAEALEDRLATQSYEDYGFVHSTAENIPTAWNEALDAATGELLVFTETDATPISDDWLETIVDVVDVSERAVTHFGIVGHGIVWNLANLAVPRHAMTEFRFDETYAIAEDTELFTRMADSNVEFIQRFDAPVYHEPRSRTTRRQRAFQQGYHQMRCLLRHGHIGPRNERRIYPMGYSSEGKPDDYGTLRSHTTKYISAILFHVLLNAGMGWGLIDNVFRRRS